MARRAAIAGLMLVSALAAGQVATKYRHIALETPLEVTIPPDAPPAVMQFHATGKNPYNGNAQAVEEGKKLYDEWCAQCHAPQGTGGMGPSLVAKQHTYPRSATDVGLFEAVYGGALGAMQPFNDRLSQDQILKVIAYINELRQKNP